MVDNGVRHFALHLVRLLAGATLLDDLTLYDFPLEFLGIDSAKVTILLQDVPQCIVVEIVLLIYVIIAQAVDIMVINNVNSQPNVGSNVHFLKPLLCMLVPLWEFGHRFQRLAQAPVRRRHCGPNTGLAFLYYW